MCTRPIQRIAKGYFFATSSRGQTPTGRSKPVIAPWDGRSTRLAWSAAVQWQVRSVKLPAKSADVQRPVLVLAIAAKRYLDKHAARFKTTADMLIQLALTPAMKASPSEMATLVNNIEAIRTIATEPVGRIQATPLITREFITATINAHFDKADI